MPRGPSRPNWWQIVQSIPAWPVQASYDFLLPVNLLIRPATPPPDASPHQITPSILPSQPLSRGDYVRLEGFVITEVDVEKKAVTLNLPPREDGLPASYRLRLQPVDAIEACCVGDEIAPIAGRVMDTLKALAEHRAAVVIATLDASSLKRGRAAGRVLDLSDGRLAPRRTRAKRGAA